MSKKKSVSLVLERLEERCVPTADPFIWGHTGGTTTTDPSTGSNWHHPDGTLYSSAPGTNDTVVWDNSSPTTTCVIGSNNSISWGGLQVKSNATSGSKIQVAGELILSGDNVNGDLSYWNGPTLFQFLTQSGAPNNWKSLQDQCTFSVGTSGFGDESGGGTHGTIYIDYGGDLQIQDGALYLPGQVCIGYSRAAVQNIGILELYNLTHNITVDGSITVYQYGTLDLSEVGADNTKGGLAVEPSGFLNNYGVITRDGTGQVYITTSNASAIDFKNYYIFSINQSTGGGVTINGSFTQPSLNNNVPITTLEDGADLRATTMSFETGYLYVEDHNNGNGTYGNATEKIRVDSGGVIYFYNTIVQYLHRNSSGTPGNVKLEVVTGDVAFEGSGALSMGICFDSSHNLLMQDLLQVDAGDFSGSFGTGNATVFNIMTYGTGSPPASYTTNAFVTCIGAGKEVLDNFDSMTKSKKNGATYDGWVDTEIQGTGNNWLVVYN